MSVVRLYGCLVGHGSAATVTAGWKQALSAHGLLGDVWMENAVLHAKNIHGMHIENVSDRDPPVAVVTDIHQLMPAMGNDHEEVHVVVALHSDWIPPNLLHMLQNERVTVLAPSADTYAKLTRLNLVLDPKLKIECVSHGVDAGFEPLTPAQRETLPTANLYKQLRYPDPRCLNWLHMCESSAERKGTYVLIRALQRFLIMNPQTAVRLTIIPSAAEHPKLAHLCASSRMPEVFQVLPRLNAHPAKLKWVYACFDAIVQPSRAEGFGLVPLEGLVMGTPCAVTERCGHSQWMLTEQGTLESGIVPVHSGANGPPLFEPAPAPVVEETDVSIALRQLADNSQALSRDARLNAQHMRARWTWPRVTKVWADAIKERYA